jgi:hypothetical protein
MTKRPYEDLNDSELFARVDRKDPIAVKEAGHRWRLLQAERLLADFENARGRRPTSMEELEAFTAERKRGPIDPYDPRRS